ncbi:type VI secretion system-associated FHA domain protein [Xenorhabdus hominickii]|uniref:Putative FHA domain protein n=1 Tax=Xenorhabdus hominickii TaxID=351679 RepID=A0A2G0Q1X4_XENHO|nr:type VI secretion system-associated FHA domain protein [Xenorhabdus hominickii]AOM40270.1 hypothetical protein A9255_06575 [Xenorhabdus hominickii]PHM53217.1 putative FHA domain protein [Xenorhabdus hominickii]
MQFTIVKNIGTNRPPQLSFNFTSPGGTIGCSTENDWILPDEEQAIASLQASVSISATGECCMINRGAASEILLNAIPMAPDRQVEVRDGDVLNIGDYQIQVINISQSSPPLATTRVLNTVLSTNPSPAQSSSSNTETNKEIPNEVWDGLENSFTMPKTIPPKTTSEVTSIQNSQQTPHELNDNNPLIKPQQHQERNPIDPLGQMETTIDLHALQYRATDPVTMFHSENNAQEDILNNCTPGTLLEWNNQNGNRGDKRGVDPLLLFADKHAQYIQNDDPLHLMLDNAEPLTSPNDLTMSKQQKTLNQDKDLSSYLTSASASPSQPLFNTEETTKNLTKYLSEEIKEDTFSPTSSSSHTDQNHEQNLVNHQYGANNPLLSDINNSNRLDIAPKTYVSHSPVPPQTKGEKLEGNLLAALLDGMGLKHIQRPLFDEHAMYQLGKLLCQLTQGIMALNASRNQLKHKANADITQILIDTNNPFKLLPSGQAVLIQMFGDHMPGFMSPEQATYDVLIDLQAHQLGMIAGLRAITTDILQTFAPSVIEQRVCEKEGVPHLPLSSTHKASLWDYLTHNYQKTVNELEQGYAPLGENFRQAYETEINRYKDSQNKAKN